MTKTTKTQGNLTQGRAPVIVSIHRWKVSCVFVRNISFPSTNPARRLSVSNKMCTSARFPSPNSRSTVHFNILLTIPSCAGDCRTGNGCNWSGSTEANNTSERARERQREGGREREREGDAGEKCMRKSLSFSSHTSGKCKCVHSPIEYSQSRQSRVYLAAVWHLGQSCPLDCSTRKNPRTVPWSHGTFNGAKTQFPPFSTSFKQAIAFFTSASAFRSDAPVRGRERERERSDRRPVDHTTAAPREGYRPCRQGRPCTPNLNNLVVEATSQKQTPEEALNSQRTLRSAEWVLTSLLSCGCQPLAGSKTLGFQTKGNQFS